MPRTVLRQFTGGISNEIDPQNLRDDQGEEAVDINLKGFALEPGEGLDPLTDAGHYYYRGEWVKDSEAVSFEESGVGVVKTYDAKRPQFEEIINDKENVARNLGPALPPGAVISGTIVSEGTRGERPAEGSHLLELPADKLGAVDTYSVNALTITNAGTGYSAGTLSASYGGFTGSYTVNSAGEIDSVKVTKGGTGYVNAPTVIITETATGAGTSGSNAVITAGVVTAPSMREHKATGTKDSNHVYFYSGQPYWVEKTGDRWNVKTRAYVNGKFTLNDVTSGNLDHNSGGSFFKENYFICWTERYIQTCPLSNSSMTVNTFDTIDTGQNGDVGSNFGFTNSSTHAATAKEITSVDICNGVVTFTQKIETANKVITKYTNSDDERWILPRDNDAYILLLRDGFSYDDWTQVGQSEGQGAFSGFFPSVGWMLNNGVPAGARESDGAYNAGDDAVKLFTVDNPSGGADWITPRDGITKERFNHNGFQGERDIGLKYICKYFPKGTWACVRQTGTNKPEIMVIEAGGKPLSAGDASQVKVTRSFHESTIKSWTQRGGEEGSRTYANNSGHRLSFKVYLKLKHIDGHIAWQGDPMPEISQWYHHFPPGSEKSVEHGYFYATFFRLGGWVYGGKVYWANRENPINYQTMSNPLHPTNWQGAPWNAVGSGQKVRDQWQRTVTEFKPSANRLYSGPSRVGHGLKLSHKPILYDGYGLVKNTIDHPLYWDNERGRRADKEYKNTSIRLGSFTPGGSITLQTHVGQSSIHTTAKISSSDSSIEFDEATTTNFVAGDNIRVSGGLFKAKGSSVGTNLRRIGLNLPLDSANGRQHEYFIARIKEVVAGTPGKLKLEAIPGFESRYMRNINEDCYPIITTIDNNLQAMPTSLSNIPTQKRRLIRTDLEINTLLGCSHGNRFPHIGNNPSIEVRDNSGAGITNSDYAHKIDWDGRTIRAVNTSGSDLRIVYMKDGFLFSQNGIDSFKGEGKGGTSPFSMEFSDKGTVHLTSSFMTVVNKGDIKVYNPSMNEQFIKGRPEKPSGLGLTGDILDGFHVANSYGIFVFVKYLHSSGREYWKMVKTGDKPTTTLLSYDFVKPIAYDGARIWGVWKDGSGNCDLHTSVPFYERDIQGSWINFSENNNGNSAWGQVLKSRLTEADKDGNIRRFLSVDWKFDSGVFYNTGDPVIGLQHEANKMVGVENTFTWYLIDQPNTLDYDGQGTIIEEPLIAIPFESKVTRDVVFFKFTETVLPASGATGAENRISFTNYEVPAQKFYVLNDSIIQLQKVGQNPEELAFQLGQADTSEDAFDASRVGKSAFLVGAPNMYNPFGPNIDFFYRASFIDKWNNESVPSPLPTSGIEPLDSADDCIQINLSADFFRFDNEDIEKIRIYRYGGDSSEFSFLKDVPVPKIKKFPIAIPSSGTGFAATFARKSTLSSFYNLNSYYDISELSDFNNSTFDVTATPGDIDGSWRINQVSENEPRKAFTATDASSDLRINSEAHGLSNDNIVRVSSTATLPGNLSDEVYYYVVSKTADTFELALAASGTSITWVNAGSGTHTWRKVGYETTLSEDLNKTNTTVKLVSAAFPAAWPASGVIKLGSEYIKYSSIVSNELRDCVRGFYDSEATEHKGPRIKEIPITGAGTNYGFDDGSGGFSSANVAATSFTDASDKIQVNATAHGMANGTALVLSTSGELPAGLSKTVLYFVVATATDSFQLATASSGTPIDVTDDDLGSGTPSFNACVIHGTGGGGTGFYAKYGVNTSTGAITSVTVGNPGSGYTSDPTLVVSDPGAAGAGAGATFTITRGNSSIASAVEWVLEMEHRNQDTTTLEAGIDTNTVPTNIFVASTDVFPSAGSILIGNHIIDYTGKSADGLSFTGCTHNAGGGIATTHSVGVLVLSYNEVYTVTSLTNVSIEINSFGYRDKSRTPVMSLHTMKEDNWPPLAMAYNEEKKQFFETEAADDFFRYITSVGSLYFGAVDADLRFSRYGSPEYWPLEAVVTLDSEIKGIKEHAGEGIVFTTNSVYRVRGTDPKAMVAFRVPDAKGVKDGDRHSIAEFNGGLIWKTANDGFCMYNAGRVSYITRDKHLIPDMEKPYACVANGVYWLFQRPKANREAGDTGNGFRLEITSGDLRLCETSIQAYYAYFARALGRAVVVTSDDTLSADDTSFVVQEIGGTKATNISWKSKKIDVGEPAVAKAFGSLAMVYESLESQTAPTLTDGIRGEALAVSLLGLDDNDLDAGDLDASNLDGSSDLYDVFTRYDSVGQEFIADIGGTNWNLTQRKTILMPQDFNTGSISAGDSIWNELLADNTKVASVGTEFVSDVIYSVTASDGSSDLLFTDADHTMQNGDEIQFTTTGTLPGNITAGVNYYVNDRTNTTFKVETVVDGGNVQYDTTAGSGVSYGKTNPTIVLDKEPLKSGSGNIIWGNLPEVHIYVNNESTPSRSFALPPIVSDEPQSVDLYLEDLRKFRTISIKVEGNLRVNTMSLRHFPLQQFQSQTLHHSADIFYKGVVDFRVKLDGELIYRKELSNAGDEFTEERIYLPASSFGTRLHYMNESRSGMIESVTFNGSMAA